MLVSAGVYPVNRHRGWMGVPRGRGLDETSRLPGARIKLRVAIGFPAQVGKSRALKRSVRPRQVTEQGKGSACDSDRITPAGKSSLSPRSTPRTISLFAQNHHTSSHVITHHHTSSHILTSQPNNYI